MSPTNEKLGATAMNDAACGLNAHDSGCETGPEPIEINVNLHDAAPLDKVESAKLETLRDAINQELAARELAAEPGPDKQDEIPARYRISHISTSGDSVVTLSYDNFRDAMRVAAGWKILNSHGPSVWVVDSEKREAFEIRAGISANIVIPAAIADLL